MKLVKEFDTNGDGVVSNDEIKQVLPDGKNDCNLEVFLENVYDNIHKLFEKPSEVETEIDDDESQSAEIDENEHHSTLPVSVGTNSELSDNNGNDSAQEIKPNRSENMEIPRIPNIDLNQPAFSAGMQAIIKDEQNAKKEYDNLDKRYTDLELSVKDCEQYIGDDFGTDMAWALLKGKCFEMDENEYIYKLCLFDKAVQKSKSSPVDTDLGYVESIH
ncbi:unnamed protein product [Onchocerca flexuosa]|uniref:EF-hand domain-containing protein n=1 Tax=Onchocerca flexuosa TaxID=387005 RepID=A0A3P8FNL6_9BILA|nr:unnamed protein product [Onchocerca flexuosa]